MVLDKLIQLMIDCAKIRFASASTPKARAARSFVRLYSAINDCHETYMRVRTVEGNLPSYADLSAWTRAVDDLSCAFERVRNQLQVFAPNVHSFVREYVIGEMNLAEDERLDALTGQGTIVPRIRASRTNCAEEHGDSDDGTPVPASTDQIPDIGTSDLARAMEDVATCRRARDLLATFIKENFAIEDLF